jgi:MFS family permease
MRVKPASETLLSWVDGVVARVTRDRIGLIASVGIALLLASELVDRLECLEGPIGLSALNFLFAMLAATLIVCTAALVGDWALTVTKRRTGRTPGARLVTPLLALAGATPACGILVAHLHHRLALDSCVALVGSLLLIVAAFAHHRLSYAARVTEREHRDVGESVARAQAPPSFVSERVPRRDRIPNRRSHDFAGNPRRPAEGPER